MSEAKSVEVHGVEICIHCQRNAKNHASWCKDKPMTNASPVEKRYYVEKRRKEYFVIRRNGFKDGTDAPDCNCWEDENAAIKICNALNTPVNNVSISRECAEFAIHAIRFMTVDVGYKETKAKYEKWAAEIEAALVVK